MFIYKVTNNRILLINELYIFIPLAILIDILIIKYVRTRRIQKKKELEKQIHKQLRLRRILTLAFAKNSALSISNGGTFTMEDLDSLLDSGRVPKKVYDCVMSYPYGASYLDSDRFLRIILDNFAYKKLKNGLIYITVSALCTLIQTNGVFQCAAPITIRDYGVTSWVQTIKKLIATGLLATGPLIIALGRGGLGARVIQVIPFAVSGIKLILWNPENIATSLISSDVNLMDLTRRIPTRTDVIVLNYKDHDKIVMPEFKPTPNQNECWLAEQARFNEKCRPYQLPEELTKPNINYEEALTLKDVTGLKDVEFEDIEDLGQISKVSKVKAKFVKFLEKFGDDPSIADEGWEASDYFNPSEKRYLRYRERN